MPITVNTAANSKKLTTLAEVKDDLGIPSGTTTYDTAINKKIDQASAAIVRYCGREFAKEDVTETLPGDGSNTLLLTRTPIISVTSLSYKGTALDTANYEISDPEAGIIFSSVGFLDTAQAGFGLSEIPVAGSRQNSYSARYIAGYWLPSFSGSPGASDILLPDDVELAARELAKMLYIGRRRDQSVKQESVVNVGSVTYFGAEDGASGGLPPMIASLLAPWVRKFI